GIPPTHVLDDTTFAPRLPVGRGWAPTNYSGGYSGRVTLRDALLLSQNVPTVRLAVQVRLDRLIAMAPRLRLHRRIPALPSAGLGAADVTLLELVAAYSAFATLGELVEPRLVTRVVDRNGHVVWASTRSAKRVLDPGVAFLVTD